VLKLFSVLGTCLDDVLGFVFLGLIGIDIGIGRFAY
jgi:hypothetical protein